MIFENNDLEAVRKHATGNVRGRPGGCDFRGCGSLRESQRHGSGRATSVATIEKVSARIRKVRFKVTPVMLSERAMTRPFLTKQIGSEH